MIGKRKELFKLLRVVNDHQECSKEPQRVQIGKVKLLL